MRFTVDAYGRFMPDQPDTAGMMFPVRCCHCGGVYDLAKVEVTARYADCSMWKSPCCRLLVDDRGETGRKSTKDYERLDASGREVRDDR